MKVQLKYNNLIIVLSIYLFFMSCEEPKILDPEPFDLYELYRVKNGIKEQKKYCDPEYRIENNKCEEYEIKQSEKSFSDYEELSKCQENLEMGECDSIPNKPCDNAVWQNYPTCEWDVSNCDDAPEPNSDSNIVVYLSIGLVLGILILIGFIVYRILKIKRNNNI